MALIFTVVAAFILDAGRHQNLHRRRNRAPATLR